MNAQTNISLWQMKSEYQNLLHELYDHETGEINQEVDAQLSALSDSAENKCIAIRQWISNLEGEKKQIEFMKEQILAREAAYEKEIQKRINYLETNMRDMKIKEIKCPYFTLRMKENPVSTDVQKQELIPEKFIRTTTKTVTTVSVDKVAIKEEVLRTGIQVPGAYVGRKTKLEFSINKL